MGAAVEMPLAEWQAIVGGDRSRPPLRTRRVPGARQTESALLPYDAAGDLKALRALAVGCQQYSPICGVEETDAPECILLDISGLEHLHRDERALAERIRGEFRTRGYATRVGLASTVGAAWAAAHDRAATAVNIVAQQATAAYLARLPVELLRLPEDILDLLAQLGIERVGQLRALRREDLSARFDPILLRRMDQAEGAASEPVKNCPPPSDIRAVQSFEYPTVRRETIEAVIERLTASVGRQLLEQGLGAVRLDCLLDCRPAEHLAEEPHRIETLRLGVGLFEPSAAAGHLAPLLLTQFERLRLPGPVFEVCVQAPATSPLEPRQRSLFADAWDEPPRRALALLDRLAVRLGSQAVLGVRLTSDAQPERAWRYELLGGGPLRRRRRERTIPPRPLTLFPQPIRLAAESLLGDAPPRQFHAHGARQRVVRHWGPERIETGWWRGRMVGRDYFQVEIETGQRYWLFRRLDDGAWFLHGAFE